MIFHIISPRGKQIEYYDTFYHGFIFALKLSYSVKSLSRIKLREHPQLSSLITMNSQHPLEHFAQYKRSLDNQSQKIPWVQNARYFSSILKVTEALHRPLFTNSSML